MEKNNNPTNGFSKIAGSGLLGLGGRRRFKKG
jgi:hypothetical protein